MYDVYDELETACHRATKELHDLNKKLDNDESNITKEDVDLLDKVTHTIASTKKGMAMLDAPRSSGRDGSYNISGTYSNGMNRRYYEGSSRGRRDGDIMQRLNDMYQDARDDREADMIRNIMNGLNR